MIKHVEQRAEESDRGQRHRQRTSGGQQCHACASAQQNVSDLPNAVERKQAFGLFLLQRLHGASK